MRTRSDHEYDPQSRPDWRILRSILPYLSEYRGRVVLAIVFLTVAKLANVAVPIALKYLVDALEEGRGVEAALLVPMALVLAYGVLRFSATFFSELRDAVFARVAERAMRRAGLQVFEHLHRLDLRFHLERRTGALARDIERGTNGMSFLLRFTLFNVIPTLLEIALVAVVLLVAFRLEFVLTVVVTVLVYVWFSLRVTEWRTRFVREANRMDNRSNTRALDSLLNYETVKYFGNESYEAARYDEDLAQWESARMKNRLSLAALNSGQALIIAVAVTVMMALATWQTAAGEMTLGDLTMINAYMIQLFIPLNALGFVYREIREGLVNVERMFRLLDVGAGVADRPGAPALKVDGGALRFRNVRFSYDAERPILKGVDFQVPAGHRVAVVGPSGAGKSTLARLLFRFYDVDDGAVEIDGQDVRDVTQASLRAAIGVVPQDTVLFNDTILANIAYGAPGVDEAAVRRAADLAQLGAFIDALPDGLHTEVGERGLKLSGGEKQRLAIARVLLKDPPILILDEATSSLDSASEQAILSTLHQVSRDRTTLAIAHRLSTVQDADQILVMEDGGIVERGTHTDLLAARGVYARLWAYQQAEAAAQAGPPG